MFYLKVFSLHSAYNIQSLAKHCFEKIDVTRAMKRRLGLSLS